MWGHHFYQFVTTNNNNACLVEFIKYRKVYIIQKGSLAVNPINKTPLKKVQ